jgi:GT2 family glycosyltransferase
MASVDLVIVNYNSGDWLRRVVAALHRQTYRRFRTIIVDNHSTDRSIDDLPAGATGVEVVRAQRNLGFAAGNNLALRAHVNASWVALLNPDAVPRTDWLERLMAATERHAEYTFFGCCMLDAKDPSRLDGIGDVYHVSGLSWREGQGCAHVPAYGRAEEIFSPCAAAALYRTRDVLDAGLFDEDFFCYSEDVDLGFRLRLRGGRCMYVPDAVVEHAGSATTGVGSDFQLYHGHRNLAWTYVKNMPGWLFWLYLPYHLFANCYSLLAFTLRGRGGPLWRAKLDAMRGLRRVWTKRRQVQALRTSTTSDLRRVMRRGAIRKPCRR